ncbi:unnamed protein product, partial [Mesorhabditis belari]|uniref:Uncharacterized protein n=1 Tax=Mesorhabditis belari TaxID=2138241 RepID=A0AAF3F970_9BILA
MVTMEPLTDDEWDDADMDDSDLEELLKRKQQLEQQLQQCGQNGLENGDEDESLNGASRQTLENDDEPEKKRFRLEEELPETPIKEGRPISALSEDAGANNSFYFSTPDQSHSEWEIPNTPARCPYMHNVTPPKSEANELNTSDDFNPLDLLEQAVDEEESTKTFLKRVPLYRPKDIIEPLPTGWREITHASGLSVYLHAETRVCTFSRPYYLGKGSVRHHEVPLCAIPCLHERKVNDFYDRKREEAAQAGSALPLGDIDVQTKGEDFGLNVQLSSNAVYEYAKTLYRIKMVKIRKNFRRWRDRAEHSRSQKELEDQRLIAAIDDGGDDSEKIRRFVLPDSVVMSAPQGLARAGKPGRQRRMVVVGKTAVNILHDYASKFLRGAKLEYIEDQTNRSAAAPYQISVYLKKSAEVRLALADNIKEKLDVLRLRENFQNGDDQNKDQLLGRGVGASKKEAKRLAAQEAVKLFYFNAPIRFNSDGVAILENEEKKHEMIEQAAENLFDDIALDDPKVSLLAPQAAIPTPLELLKLILQKTSKYANLKLEWKDGKRFGKSKFQVCLKLDTFEVKQEAEKRQSAEQLCAQHALKYLHRDTEITSYGALLKIYAQDLKQQYEGIKEQKEVTKLQTTQKSSGNTAVLSKLCEELKKLEETKIRRDHPLCSTKTPILL